MVYSRLGLNVANEITFGWKTGKNLTFGVYTAAGVEREVGTSMTETPASSGVYLGTPAAIVTSDFVIVSDDDASKVIGQGPFNPAGILSPDGLDSVSTTEPSGLASNFREQMVQLWRRFFGKGTISNTEILTYKEDGVTIATTQTALEEQTLVTQGEAS